MNKSLRILTAMYAKLVKIFVLLNIVLFMLMSRGKLFAQDWVVVDSQVVENQSITLDGNLIIEASGSLTLRGVTLAINNNYHGEYGIQVQSGGSIIIDGGSTITATDDSARLTFIVDTGATFIMRNSELSRCGWYSPYSASTEESAGLIVYANEPICENCTFTDNDISIRLVRGSGGRIIGCQFLNSPLCYSHVALIGWTEVEIKDNIFSSNPWSGVTLEYNANDNIINNNQFDHNMHGAIYTRHSWGNEFVNNQVIGGEGPYITQFSGNNRIINNQMSNITIFNSNNNLIQSNTFSGSTHWTILLSYSNDNIISNNFLSNNTGNHALACIELFHASNNTVMNNYISVEKVEIDCIVQMGLLAWGSSRNNVIEGNEIFSARRGISLHYFSDQNLVTYNAIYSSEQEGILIESSSDNVIHHNNIVDSKLRAYDDTGENRWDDGTSGNYWSDYTGDGSTPYALRPLGVDYHPLQAPVIISSAAVPPFSPAPISDIYTEPDWRITSDTLVQDQTLYCTINVAEGGTLTLKNATVLLDGRVAERITVDSGGALYIYDSYIRPENPEAGGYLFQAMPNSIFVMKNSELHGVGIHPGAGDWAGLYILTSNAIIENNLITDAHCAVGIYGANSNVLNNKILYCETGISNGANNLLTGNTISKCLMEGIVVGGDGPSTIENNSISNIREMAILNYTHKSNFISNTISYSHRGIDTYGSDNKVYGNTFISNRIQAYEHGGSLWDYEGQGNYWNDYSGVDTNGDGIGDTPYSIFPIGMDSYPLMESTVDIPPISVSVIPVSLSFSDIAAGDTNIALVKINLKVTPADSAQIASWAGIRVDRSGTIEDDEILSVEIWNDVDGNERFDAGSDGEIAEGHFSNGTVTITFSSFEEIIPYSQTYFIVFDISDTLSDSNSTIGVKFADSSYFKFLYPAEVLATNFPFESELFPVAELEHTEDIPETFELSQNYPNPFNSETIIKYQLPKSTEVELKIYNILGQQVAVLVDEKQNAGYYRVKWSGTNDRGSKVVSGIYICRLQSKEFVKSFKLIVLR